MMCRSVDFLVWACGGRHHDGDLVQLDSTASCGVVEKEEQRDE
jgi:hypothetical protein